MLESGKCMISLTSGVQRARKNIETSETKFEMTVAIPIPTTPRSEKETKKTHAPMCTMRAIIVE